MTAIRTNDSGDVVVTKIKKSDLEHYNNKNELPPLVLKPRDSLDPESSLKRNIDEYIRVMEKQEQLLEDKRRSSFVGDNNEIVETAQSVQEEAYKRKLSKQVDNSINQLQTQEPNEKSSQQQQQSEKKKSIKICIIS